MKTSTVLWVLGTILIVVGLATWVYAPVIPKEEPAVILSFADCESAGYPVAESSPRQCHTPDGRTYAEELPLLVPTYANASSDLVVVDLPMPNSVVGKQFSIMGRARSVWFSDASFPITVFDKDGLVLTQGAAEAQGEWMTEEFVPFLFEARIPETYIGPATIVLKGGNPSGEPEQDRSVSFPITIEY